MAPAGVTRLRLIPIECVPTGAHQRALWGGSGDEDERAHRALARVQTLLGHGSVLTAVVDGGRDPLQRTRLVPWGDEPAPLHSPQLPWPGRLPPPAPSVLIDPPRPIQVLDDAGQPVWVTERGAVPAPPARLGLPGESARTDHLLGRALAGRRALVGSGVTGCGPGPVPAGGRARAGLSRRLHDPSPGSHRAGP